MAAYLIIKSVDLIGRNCVGVVLDKAHLVARPVLLSVYGEL